MMTVLEIFQVVASGSSLVLALDNKSTKINNFSYISMQARVVGSH